VLPWHGVGFTHGWGLVATWTSCLNKMVALGGGESQKYCGWGNSVHSLVHHDVGHQFRICRHLSGGYCDRMLSKEAVAFAVIECERSTVVILVSRTVRLALVVGEKAIRFQMGGRVEGAGLGIEGVHVHGGGNRHGDG